MKESASPQVNSAKRREDRLNELARLKLRHSIRLRMYGVEERKVPYLHISDNPLYSKRLHTDLSRAITEEIK